MMDLVLSVPATEAVCERFFRHSSLFAKRQYVTNLNEETARDYSYIKHYLNPLWRLFVDSENVKDVFGISYVCLN